MIKKTTAVAFLMLANILILAHTVVPHHHHEKQVCLENSHCIHDGLTPEHDNNRDSHSHDGENNHDDCVLKTPVVVFSNQWKPDFKYNNTADCSDLDIFHYNLLISSTKYMIPVLSSFISERVTDDSYSSLVSASLGLRAPPVV
jgi:hypothetical protein